MSVFRTSPFVNLAQKNHEFWFTPLPNPVLTPLRIALALCFLLHYLETQADLLWVYGVQGIGHYHDLGTFIMPDWLLAPLSWAIVAFSVAMLVGYKTRFCGFVILALHTIFEMRGLEANWGWMRMVTPVLLFGLLGNMGAHFSFDRFLACRSNPDSTPTPENPWAIRLLQIQLCVLYAVTCLHRLDDPQWISGNMLFFALDSELFMRWTKADLWPLLPYSRLLCWGAWSLELLAPILLWCRRTRRMALVLLVALHVVLELSVTTGKWQYLMVGLVLLFNYPARRVHQ